MSGATSNDPGVKALHDRLSILIKEIEQLNKDVEQLKRQSSTGPSEAEIKY